MSVADGLLKGDRYSLPMLPGFPDMDPPIPFDNLKAYAVIDRDPGDEQPEADGVERNPR